MRYAPVVLLLLGGLQLADADECDRAWSHFAQLSSGGQSPPVEWKTGFLQHCRANKYDAGCVAGAATLLDCFDRCFKSPPASPIPAAQIDYGKHIQCIDRACHIDAWVKESLLGNNARALATAARFVPMTKDGKVQGLRVFGVRPDSIFGRLGIQNGDTLLSINGLPLATAEELLTLYVKTSQASQLSVAIERRGAPLTIEITIH